MYTEEMMLEQNTKILDKEKYVLELQNELRYARIQIKTMKETLKRMAAFKNQTSLNDLL